MRSVEDETSKENAVTTAHHTKTDKKWSTNGKSWRRDKDIPEPPGQAPKMVFDIGIGGDSSGGIKMTLRVKLKSTNKIASS